MRDMGRFVYASYYMNPLQGRVNIFARWIAGSSPAMTALYRGARFAKIRCSVRRCMFSRRAVSETLRLHIS